MQIINFYPKNKRVSKHVLTVITKYYSVFTSISLTKYMIFHPSYFDLNSYFYLLTPYKIGLLFC